MSALDFWPSAGLPGVMAVNIAGTEQPSPLRGPHPGGRNPPFRKQRMHSYPKPQHARSRLRTCSPRSVRPGPVQLGPAARPALHFTLGRGPIPPPGSAFTRSARI